MLELALKKYHILSFMLIILSSDMETFQPEAAAVLEELVHSQPLQLEVTAHEEDGVPYINLFLISRDQVRYRHPTPCGVAIRLDSW